MAGVVEVFIGDSYATFVKYDPDATVCEVRQRVLQKLDVKTLVDDYHLFQVTPSRSEILEEDARIADVIRDWPSQPDVGRRPSYRLVCKKLFLNAEQL